MNFNLSVLISLLFSFFIMQHVYAQKSDEEQIRTLISNFSKAVMASDYEGIASSYTENGKIFPSNTDIIEGTESIRKYWTLSEGTSIPYHKIIPEEIKILNDHAYDYGRYEGKTKRKDGSEVSWKGKYVIVWKKIKDEWKIHLDIWNRIN